LLYGFLRALRQTRAQLRLLYLLITTGINRRKHKWKLIRGTIFVQTLSTEYLSYGNLDFEIKNGGAHAHYGAVRH